MFNIIFYTLLSIGMLLYSAGAHSLTLIAHPDTPSTLNAQQVKRIFTGKQRQFDDGSSVIPINQPEGSAVQNLTHQYLAARPLKLQLIGLSVCLRAKVNRLLLLFLILQCYPMCNRPLAQLATFLITWNLKK